MRKVNIEWKRHTARAGIKKINNERKKKNWYDETLNFFSMDTPRLAIILFLHTWISQVISWEFWDFWGLSMKIQCILYICVHVFYSVWTWIIVTWKCVYTRKYDLFWEEDRNIVFAIFIESFGFYFFSLMGCLLVMCVKYVGITTGWRRFGHWQIWWKNTIKIVWMSYIAFAILFYKVK